MKKKENMKPAVLILAGGLSERMQFPKPWLPFNDDLSFLEKIVKEYLTFGCRKIVVVINENFCRHPWEELISKLSIDVTIVRNYHPEKGKAHSVIIGLEFIDDNSFLFIQNIDNPFISRALLSAMYRNRNVNDFTVPVYKKRGGHPILVSNKIINDIRQHKGETLNLKITLRNYYKSEIEFPKKEILANINTQEQYESFFNKEMILT